MDDLHEGRLLSVEDAILYVLERYWDPLHLQNQCARRGAYGKYVAPVRDALTRNPSAESLIDFLGRAKVKDFGIVDLPGTRERRAARKLLEIDIRRDEANPD